ncbi:hypothetical protein A2318_00225 [Candidatus Uhrbacteria bacterium RIFOXYB2_FULL_45_11]|uniref:Uncharacterized protein n=1 Tax=Candidatus Uhrbacteria bacterium RIFOXYB2_FULL_45_11 TaxID=1802421 RepID=A0A1F7WAR9_9BACT|nr:MAG: hypothetical protein A2318_00225 [Candidatus Uhrbacteria bacterium RIFOXYB2_FULL_45_11]
MYRSRSIGPLHAAKDRTMSLNQNRERGIALRERSQESLSSSSNLLFRILQRDCLLQPKVDQIVDNTELSNG